MEGHNIPYFRNLWQMNVGDLENQCKAWEKICCDNQIPEDVLGEIRTAIGLARLLINQKLKQFKGLIDDSEFRTGEKEITCSDLTGFWDMVYFEVEKIHKSFNRLDKCKSNEWRFVEEHAENPIKKKAPAKKDVAKDSSKKKELLKAQMLAARQRLAEAKKKMMAERKEGKEQNVIEILHPYKERKISNSVDNGSVISTSALTIKTVNKKLNENKKQSLPIDKNDDILAEKSDFAKETLNLNDVSKSKATQKKKHSASVCDKENIYLNNDISGKQTKSTESEARKPEKAKRLKEFGKLQCVTRSAAKKLQQNALQKS